MERQEFQHEALSPLVFCVVVPISLSVVVFSVRFESATVAVTLQLYCGGVCVRTTVASQFII